MTYFINPLGIESILPHIEANQRIKDFYFVGPVQKCALLEFVDDIVKEVLVDEYGDLKYGWNDVNEGTIPSGKLQFYTTAGTCIYGKASEFKPGFITHWAYCLPSPTKQAGAIK